LNRLGKLEKIRFVQIGANDGVRFDDLYQFVISHPCEGLVVEPLPDLFAKLAANYADHPRIKPVNLALHATEQSVLIYRVAPDELSAYPAWAAGIASFDRDHLLQHQIRADDIKSEQVRCVPLMHLLSEHDLMELELLQIDTEGYDAEVVRMIDFTRCRPLVIRYEHKSFDAQLRADLERTLKRKGYRVGREATDTVAWR
jgi:FkbM family methyltransferase